MEATDKGRESSPPEEQPGTTGTTIGARLAAGREARGMTIEDVAQELRLSVATLRMLESDRFDELPEPIFVRGYLRTYSRLLEMDEQALVAEYESLAGTSEPELSPTSTIRRQATPSDPFFRGATLLILAAIAILLGVWWFSGSGPEPQIRTAGSDAATPAAERQEPLPVEDSSETVLPPPPDLEAVSEPIAEAPRVQPQASVPEPPASAAQPPSESPLPIIEEPDGAQTAQADDGDPEAGPEQGAEPASPATSQLPVAPLASERGRLVAASRAPRGADVLVLSAQEETWAEVVDANGFQLLYYLLRPGMERRMQGEAPFRVFLGNAPAVELSLNNERFDHSNFHRPNRTARFTVDVGS